MKRVGIARSVLLSLILFTFAQLSLVAAAPEGKVVWWGRDVFWENNRPTYHTNGVIEFDGEIVSNITAMAGKLFLRQDGTVFTCGRNFHNEEDIPPDATNIVSIISQRGSHWAIRRDGTVVRWGSGDSDPDNWVGKLTNVASIYAAGYQHYMAIQRDGGVLSLDLNPVQGGDPERVKRIEINRQPIRDIVAVAIEGDSTPVALKKNGDVFSLSVYTDPVTGIFSVTLVPIETNGFQLTDVTALAGGSGHVLALKKDGTVVALGNDPYGAATVPQGLSNVVAVAAAQNESLALKRDGTVVAWGADYSRQTLVPAGLSNVIAIASAGDFNLALTTGDIPPSVYIAPHGKLETMERDADLVIKAKAISSQPVTNKAFPDWGAPVATKMAVISVLKGNPATNEITFLHLTHGPMVWSGSRPPPDFVLRDGESYLIFAKSTGTTEWLYSPSGPVSGPGEFRQLMQKGEVPIRTLDDRPLDTTSVKEAHWRELNLLLNSAEPTNQLYAIEHLDAFSLPHRSEREWDHSEDFRRTNVLKALVPLVLSTNAQVARRAIDCFGVNKDSTALLEPFTPTLIGVANESSSAGLRIQAITALSGTHFEAISNSMLQLLRNPNDKVRSRAVELLALYPGDLTDEKLRRMADDASPQVRAAVAEVIGDLKAESLLPTLANLFQGPIGRDKPLGHLSLEDLEAGGRIWPGPAPLADDPNYAGPNNGDVHTITGDALLKFDTPRVADILRTNLNEPGFRFPFLLKLAGTNAGPWLDDLTAIMEKRHETNVKKAQALNEPLDAYNYLSGNYFRCWQLIYDYLEQQPAAEFRPRKNGDGRFDRYLNMLEQAGITGSQKQVPLYKLYRAKGLTDRAARIRQKYPRDKEFFDRADKEP